MTFYAEGAVVFDPEGRVAAIAVSALWAGKLVDSLNTHDRILEARAKAGIGEQRVRIPADQIERANQQVGGPLTLVPPLPPQICERVTWHDCSVTGNWSRH